MISSASGLQFLVEPAIGRYVDAARRPDLHEAERAFQLGMQLEQAIDRGKPFGNALGIVDAIDAHQDLFVAEPQTPAEPPFGTGMGQRQTGLHQLGIDADRIGPDAGRQPAAGHRKMLPVDLGFQRAVDGVQEVVAVVLDVEGQQVVAQQAVENFLLPGADAEHLGIRPGNVPELDHDQIARGRS